MPITVRQLEAMIRIAESLARMQLAPEAGERHAADAVALFEASTIDAMKSGLTTGALNAEQLVEVRWAC